MADKGKRPGGKGRWIGILVVIALAIVVWWVFDQWSQPPAIMPADGDDAGAQVDDSPPDTNGSPPAGNGVDQ